MPPLPMAPEPRSPLARYRMLSPTASVRVSPLCLGAMNFGDAWRDYMGACDRQTVEDILDFFYDQGGNFIDTANNYQAEESETWIGEWMRKRGVRDQMVIATKFTTNFRAGHNDEIMINFQGNGTKSLHVSVNRSLQKLQTDYIDLLYVHWWDHSTSIPELMQSLNALVAAGKVLYLGASDAPAWAVATANQYARDHGLRPFSVYQGRWSAAARDFERDLLPMARAEGMALAPWGALGGGGFKTREQREESKKSGKGHGRAVEPSERDVAVSAALENVARRRGTLLTSVAQAYVMHKAPYVFPIVGGRTVEHLRGNIAALTVALDDEDVREIEAAAPFDIGFPASMLYGDRAGHGRHHPGEVWLLGMGGVTDYVDEPRPIPPRRHGD
ncbi:aldo/keto reductase [Xylariaceae sp. FL0804]|nr:aldo/keto reductase [Xylariaceae sp. FL0804]